MIVYYAVGGGLGHLTRGLRVIEKLGLQDVVIVTASPYAERVCRSFLRVPAHLEHDREAHRAWLRELGAERLIADTFPGGIQGELCGLDVPIDCVTRLLRWDAYRAAVPFALPEIGTTYVVEEPIVPLPTGAGRGGYVALDLSLPFVEPVEEEPYWLIVHSGPEEEVRELVAYADELRALAEKKPERVIVASHADVWPASALFPAAAKIITAAGFNVMLETEQWRAKHVAVPFARRFDDQFLRAARRKRLSSANAPGPAAQM
jgi:predicted glycosyltransferase